MPNRQLGLFIQLIDVGAIASSRLIGSDSLVANSPEIGFAQVVAPGAYVTLAIRNTPLSVGVGGSYVPKLRRSLGAAAVDTSLNAIRWGVFFAIDIGIFP